MLLAFKTEEDTTSQYGKPLETAKGKEMGTLLEPLEKKAVLPAP